MLRDQILIQNYIITQPYYLYTVFKFLKQNYAARHFLASKESSNENLRSRVRDKVMLGHTLGRWASPH